MKINILILSDQPNERLLAEIQKENKNSTDHQIIGSVISPNDLMIQLPGNASQGKVFKSNFENKPVGGGMIALPDDILPGISIVIPLLETENFDLGTDLVRVLTFAGIYSTAPAHMLENTRNIFKTNQLLMGQNLPIVNQTSFFSSDRVNQLIDILGGFPVVGKVSVSGEPVATTKLNDLQSVAIFLQSSHKSTGRFTVSRFIDSGESSFAVVRSIVLNPFAESPDFWNCENSTDNLHTPNKITPETSKATELKDTEKEVVKKAAQTLGADLCQVNFIRDKKQLGKPVIIGIQSFPEFETMERILSKNIAAKIITFTIGKLTEEKTNTKSFNQLRNQFDQMGISDKVSLAYHADWMRNLNRVNKGLRLIRNGLNRHPELEGSLPDVSSMIFNIQDVMDQLESLRWVEKI